MRDPDHIYIPPEDVERIAPGQEPGRHGAAADPPPAPPPPSHGPLPSGLSDLLSRIGTLGQAAHTAVEGLRRQFGTPGSTRPPNGRPAPPPRPGGPNLGRPPVPPAPQRGPQPPSAAGSGNIVPLLLAGLAGVVATGIVVATVSSAYRAGQNAEAEEHDRNRRRRRNRARKRRRKRARQRQAAR